MTKMTSAIVFLLAAHAAAHMSREHVVGVPSFQYKQDCGRKSDIRITPAKKLAFAQEANIPGAGIDEFQPFETVLKDGFMLVDCVKDYMFYRGDKFGDNKHDYKLGDTSNVSIVHYEDYVPKEDRAEMTQKVCFEFCRTVPNMGFFGIVNGRGCYCTPFFKPMESDSTQCDAVCEGENTLMCGGKSKSSIFSMHMCASTEEDVKKLASEAEELETLLDAKAEVMMRSFGALQDGAQAAQDAFGQVGDSVAAGLAQDAKVTAGKMEKLSKDSKAAAEKLKELYTEARGMSAFADPAVVTKAERNMEATEEALAAGESLADQLDEMTDATTEKVVKDAAKQYYPVMYFVDKDYVEVPTTCGGDTVGEPMAAQGEDGKDQCAAACDAAVHTCIAYQYFGKEGTGGCFLFSKLKTVSYYTGCSEGKASFLQLVTKKKAPSLEASCYAKFSKFEGTTLKVDKSGKTAWGLKELTKADRCY